MGSAPILGLKGHIARAEGESLDELQRAILREIRREWSRSIAVPRSLVEAKSLATSRCEHAWRIQRLAGDWNGFLFEADNLHRLVTRVKPGLIRVEADELTYPAHVILRYQIERSKSA